MKSKKLNIDMITLTTKNTLVVWQETADECGIPEPAILVSPYIGTITLEQNGNTINLNYESAKDLIKAIQTTVKNEPKK